MLGVFPVPAPEPSVCCLACGTIEHHARYTRVVFASNGAIQDAAFAATLLGVKHLSAENCREALAHISPRDYRICRVCQEQRFPRIAQVRNDVGNRQLAEDRLRTQSQRLAATGNLSLFLLARRALFIPLTRLSLPRC